MLSYATVEQRLRAVYEELEDERYNEVEFLERFLPEVPRRHPDLRYIQFDQLGAYVLSKEFVKWMDEKDPPLAIEGELTWDDVYPYYEDDETYLANFPHFNCQDLEFVKRWVPGVLVNFDMTCPPWMPLWIRNQRSCDVA